MQFQIGDSVVHTTYGLGVIVEIDQKVIAGNPTDCYVLEVGELTIWVPVKRGDSSSLRLLTPASRFGELFDILRSPSQPLASDRLMRRNYLVEQLKDGSLEAICQVVRDLTALKRSGKMNDHDKTILVRAEKFLLSEWEVVLSATALQAEQKLRQLLSDSISNTSVVR